MAPGQKWPECGLCKSKMIFFFQLDIEQNLDLPLKDNSHLLVFMCPLHNDAPSSLIERDEPRLPEKYWQKDFGHYLMLLNMPDKKEVRGDAEPRVVACQLRYVQDEEEIHWDGRTERGGSGFKLGGVPAWIGEPEFPECACGADMVFVAQVPEHFLFPKATGAPIQPDPHRDDAYALFAGRAIYIFACRDQCTPYSVYAVTQDAAEIEAQSA